jgi:hypothetical protein
VTVTVEKVNRAPSDRSVNLFIFIPNLKRQS